MTFLPGLALQWTMTSCCSDLARATCITCFLARPLYQTAVPGGQIVGIFLERVGQLGAGQLLNIEIAVAVGVGFEFDLSKSRSGDNKNRAAQHEFFRDHWTLL